MILTLLITLLHIHMCSSDGGGVHSHLQMGMVKEGPNYLFQVYIKLPNESFSNIFYFYFYKYALTFHYVCYI